MLASHGSSIQVFETNNKGRMRIAWPKTHERSLFSGVVFTQHMAPECQSQSPSYATSEGLITALLRCSRLFQYEKLSQQQSYNSKSPL